MTTQPQLDRSQPDDYWKSKGFCRRYTVSNVASIHKNEGVRAFDSVTFMAQAQGTQYLCEKPESIVDFGCGYAMRGMRLANYFGSTITGVDYSEAMLDEARNIMEKIPEDKRATLVKASAEDLPFADSQFDIGISYGLLMSLPTLEGAADELMRVVRHGIVIIEETPAAMSEAQYTEWNRVRTKVFPGRIYWHDYLAAFGHYPNIVYTPLPVPDTWNLGPPPGYARFIISKGAA